MMYIPNFWRCHPLMSILVNLSPFSHFQHAKYLIKVAGYRSVRKTVSFSFLFRVRFTVAAKMFHAALDFINAHLQQRDQVASILHTVDIW